MQKFNVTAFSLSLGLLWGIGVFFLAIMSIWGIGDSWITLLSDGYLGLKPGIVGAFIGFIWAFADGFVGGLIFSMLYNWFSEKFAR